MQKSSEHTIERPPIVAVLGHVDHGKSTLLDFIRKSNVVAGEAGGITQHVAAYEVVHERHVDGVAQKKRITFIDTPGHAAFTAIRARGANVADIAILVVAADDGVKAQTLEALQQIRDAKIPFIVAINKIDKPNADVAATQRSLLDKEVYLEKLGGDVPWVAISAKTGTGVPELLDLILLVAEMEALRADPAPNATGYVIEAHRDQKRGLAATLIITNGTLRSGMAVLAGRAVSPVRIMEDHTGKTISEATFSSPISLIGFDELPEVGTAFHAFRNKREAEIGRPAASKVAAHGAAEIEGVFTLAVIVRADTTGSLEAIEQELARLGDEHTRISIVQSGLGAVSENDVKVALSGAHPSLIIGFNVPTDPIAEALARERGVTIELFDIIYKLTEKATEILQSSAPKREVEEILGRAKIIKQFSSRKEEHVVGGKVLEGYLKKGGVLRVLRRNTKIGEGKLRNVQTNKQNVDRVDAPSEFGAQVEAPFEIAQGDVVECVVRTMK